MLRLVAALAITFLAVASVVEAGPCPGYCQPNNLPCGGGYRAHLCPGPSNIQCCAASTPSCPGQCQADNLPCGGTYASHLCPGPANIRCCESGPPPPPPPPPGHGCRAFADSQWDCTTPSCSQRVPAGSSQEQYGCAEFTSRSLASNGYIALSPVASQSEYGRYNYAGTIYNLNWVSKRHGGPTGIEDYLRAKGWSDSGGNANAIRECSAIMCEDWGHAIIGVGANMVDAHNNARLHVSGSNYHLGAVWNTNHVFNETAWREEWVANANSWAAYKAEMAAAGTPVGDHDPTLINAKQQPQV